MIPKKSKPYLFLFTFLLFIAFSVNLIRFNVIRNQYIKIHGYNVTEMHQSMLSVGDENLIELNKKIIYQEMAVAALGWIVFATMFFYVLNNHSLLIDKWRKLRGVQYKPFLVAELDKAAGKKNQ